jgi:hypothetical protein
MKEIDTSTTYSQYHDFTMARYDYNLMEMRLLLDILFLTDKYMKGGNTFTLDMGSIYKEGDDIKMRIPYEVILGGAADDEKSGSKTTLQQRRRWTPSERRPSHSMTATTNGEKSSSFRKWRRRQEKPPSQSR